MRGIRNIVVIAVFLSAIVGIVRPAHADWGPQKLGWTAKYGWMYYGDMK